jgi:ketosteroid isomerase-like protein
MLKHFVVAIVALASTAWTAPPEEDTSAQVVAIERGALDRWCKGDPGGYLDIYDPDVTYFDPGQERRVDGLPAMKALLEPIAGKVRLSRYDMINPKVQRLGDVAVLSYNILTYRKESDGSEPMAARWNSTAVYRRTGGTWKSIHSPWSYIKPELKVAPREEAR